jgi:diguanylate cyclase (GGDEF)-like protein
VGSSDPTLAQLLAALTTDGASALPILELLLSNVEDGVAITNASGGILHYNGAAKRILGIREADGPLDIRKHGAELCYLHTFDPVPEDELPLVRALRGDETKDVELLATSPALPEGALICLNARPIQAQSGEVVGGVAVFHDLGARRRAEEELRQANQKLESWVNELEARASVTHLMNDMADLLQSCRTMKEFCGVISRFAQRIFEREAGAVYLVNPSRTSIEIVAEWGQGVGARERVFAPDACWALRRGRMHRAGAGALGPECEHASGSPEHALTCIPMMAQGEALGVLHVRHAPTETGELGAALAESRLRTMIAVGEHIASALANLKLRESLRSQAIRDPLTGLFNRRYMEESLEREIQRAQRAGGAVSAIMIDVDHFKKFNDTFGHAAADVALREVAQTIRNKCFADDIACRFGGEELVVILPDTGVEEAAARAEAIRAAIEALQVRHHDQPLGPVTASFGVASFPAHGGDVEKLLRAADEALYDAKRSGRNRVSAKAIPAGALISARPTSAPAPLPTPMIVARYGS